MRVELGFALTDCVTDIVGQVTEDLLHACLEWKSPEIKVLRWDFDELSVHYTHSDQNNWIWNQNQRDLREITILNFYYVRFRPLFIGFGSFFHCLLVLMIQDDWINASNYRHILIVKFWDRIFTILTPFDRIMAILVKL